MVSRRAGISFLPTGLEFVAMSVHPDEDAESRGRIPAHDVKWSQGRLSAARQAFLNDGTRRRTLLLSKVAVRFKPQRTPRFRKQALRMRAHYESFDMVARAPKVFDGDPIDEPWEHYSGAAFEDYAGFSGPHFMELCTELELLPDEFKLRRCKASRALGLFVVCARWRMPGKWDKVAEMLRRGLTWVKTIYRRVVDSLAQYRNCVTCIDILRMRDALGTWDEECEALGLSSGAFFFLDGKATKWTKPGCGAAATALAAANGAGVNLVQRAFYNGHYMFHGAKVQHCLSLDGMLHSFALPLRAHDSAVLHASGLESSIKLLDRPAGLHAAAVTDAAYRRTDNVRPRHTEAEYAAMAGPAAAAARIQDAADAKVRNCVEFSFNDVITKWIHADYARAHKVFQSGTNNWPELAMKWDLMVFLSNCSCCLRGGARCSILGVEPPSLRDYLKNRHLTSAAFPDGHLM